LFLSDRPDLAKEYKDEATNAFGRWLRTHPQMENKAAEAVKLFMEDYDKKVMLQNLHHYELQNLSWLSSLWSSF